MSRMSGSFQSRRRARQGSAEGGRSRARSFAPVIVLGTCMIAVLYGNATYYSDTFRQNHRPGKAAASHGASTIEDLQSGSSRYSQPVGGVDARGSSAAAAAATAVVSHAATENPAPSFSSKKPLAEEEQLPAPPVAAVTEDGGGGIVEVEGEGGLQDHWDDDDGSDKSQMGLENQDGKGVQDLMITIGGAAVEGSGAAEAEEVEGEEGGREGDVTEQDFKFYRSSPPEVAGDVSGVDGSNQEASPGSGEEGGVLEQGGSEREEGEGAAPDGEESVSGLMVGEAGAGEGQELVDGGVDGASEGGGGGGGQGEGEGEGGYGLAGVAASRSSDSASETETASASEGEAGSSGGAGEGEGVGDAADVEVEGLASDGREEKIAASASSFTSTSEAPPVGAQEEQPEQEQQQQQQQQQQTSEGDAPEGLLQPGDEQGQREQQALASQSYAPEGVGLLQPGDEQGQQEQEQGQQEQEQQEQEPARENTAPEGDAAEGLLQPGGEQGQVGQQEQQATSENSVPDGAPEGLLQPGEASDAKPEDQTQEASEKNYPEGSLQPGDGEDAREEEEQQEDQAADNTAPEVLLQPGEGEDGQQPQEEEEQQQENQAADNTAPEVLLQPGDGEDGQQPQEEEEQQQEDQAADNTAPEVLLQPGDGEDGQQPQEEEEQQQEDQAADNTAPEVLLQPGDGEDGQQPQEEEQQQQQEDQAADNTAPEVLLQPGDGEDGQQPQEEEQQQQQEDQAADNTAPEVLLQPGEGEDEQQQQEEEEQGNNGAVQGSMQCATTRLGEGVDSIVNIATWKDVPGDADYRHPLAEENAGKYVTLQKDLGGFNNIRLTLESGVAFAAATGRTFVIPPPFTIWNMNARVQKKEVDLRDLFSFDKLRESGRVKIITTQEFMQEEAFTGHLGVQPGDAAMSLSVEAVSSYLVEVAGQYEAGLPDQRIEQSAFVLPRRLGERVDLEDESYAFAKKWLYGRELLEYREAWEQAKVIHWRAKEARLLGPFYAIMLHSDEVADRYHKRLLRDLMHYPEEVYCKASQVISLLRQEDPSGEFSTFHVRRNDFGQSYKMVDIPVADVISNSVDHLMDNEVVYIATDEKDLSLFEPFHKHVRVKFISDYYERAGVSELNPNLLGMLDQIIASHGRTFTGCWLSTFTGYILRLRGHLQKPRTSNFSYYKPKAVYHHEYKLPENPLWMTEWPLGWEGIDETGVPDAAAA